MMCVVPTETAETSVIGVRPRPFMWRREDQGATGIDWTATVTVSPVRAYEERREIA
jgi:hypothetical protein